MSTLKSINEPESTREVTVFPASLNEPPAREDKPEVEPPEPVKQEDAHG